MSFLVIKTLWEESEEPLICAVLVSPRRARRILRRMNLARDVHEEDSSLRSVNYFDSGGVEFFEPEVSLPEGLYQRLTDDEVLVLDAYEMRKVLDGSRPMRADMTTQVVSDETVTWRAYIRHCNTRLLPVDVKRSVFEQIKKETK